MSKTIRTMYWVAVEKTLSDEEIADFEATHDAPLEEVVRRLEPQEREAVEKFFHEADDIPILHVEHEVVEEHD